MKGSQKMDPRISASAALKWFRYKAYIHDDNGNENSFREIKSCLERYNGNSNPKYDKKLNGETVNHCVWYANKILELSK